MVKAAKKKQKAVDFKKVKLKVGRKLKRANETKVDVSMKQLVIRSQYDTKSANMEKPSQLLRKLDVSSSDDRLKALNDLQKSLDAALKPNQSLPPPVVKSTSTGHSKDIKSSRTSSTVSVDDIPIIWLPFYFRRYCLDTSPAVISGTVRAVIAFVKLVQGGPKEWCVVDCVCDLVRSLLSKTSSLFRWEGLRLLDHLLLLLPDAFKAALRREDAILTLEEVDRFCADIVKNDYVTRIQLDHVLNVTAKLLDIAQQESHHDWIVKPNTCTAGPMSSDDVISLKRYQWSCPGEMAHEWIQSGQGDRFRFTADQLATVSSFSWPDYVDRIEVWVTKLGKRLLEEDLEASNVESVENLSRICIHIQKCCPKTPSSNSKKYPSTDRTAFNGLVKTLVQHAYPIEIDYQPSSKRTEPDPGWTDRTSVSSKQDLNILLDSTNRQLFHLGLWTKVSPISGPLSPSLCQDWSTFLRSRLLPPTALSQTSIMAWLRLVEIVLIRLDDAHSDRLGILGDKCLDQVYSLFKHASLESRVKRRAVVVLTLAWIRRNRQYSGHSEELRYTSRTCLDKLMGHMVQIIQDYRKSTDPEKTKLSPRRDTVCTIVCALIELKRSGIPAAILAVDTIVASDNSSDISDNSYSILIGDNLNWFSSNSDSYFPQMWTSVLPFSSSINSLAWPLYFSCNVF